MRRVLILGSGAAGKTTFARKLAAIIKLPLIHLDALYWKPGWQKTPTKEWEGVVRDLIGTEEWIIDGSYFGTLLMRLERADTAIYLDYSRWVSFWHVLKRRVQYRDRGCVRPGLPEGCPEQIFGTYLKWLWKYPKRDRVNVMKLLAAFGKSHDVVILRSMKEAERYLKSLQ